MIATGFEIAFGIFLFVIALTIIFTVLPTVLTTLGVAIVSAWAWASKRGTLAQAIVLTTLLMIFIGILVLLGIVK